MLNIASKYSNKLKSVILIDNNDIDNFINQKILENIGVADILVFTKTSDALNYLKQTENILQLILVDIYLPFIDGFEFVDKLKELAKPINLFILTASINPEDKQKAIEKKCEGFIIKPLTSERLLQQFEASITGVFI